MNNPAEILRRQTGKDEIYSQYILLCHSSSNSDTEEDIVFLEMYIPFLKITW